MVLRTVGVFCWAEPKLSRSNVRKWMSGFECLTPQRTSNQRGEALEPRHLNQKTVILTVISACVDSNSFRVMTKMSENYRQLSMAQRLTKGNRLQTEKK